MPLRLCISFSGRRPTKKWRVPGQGLPKPNQEEIPIRLVVDEILYSLLEAGCQRKETNYIYIYTLKEKQ